MEQEQDEVLTELRDAVTPILDVIEEDAEGPRAALVIAGRELTDAEGEYSGIQTFIDCCGDYGIIGESLYSELMSQIEEDKPALFNLLREVIKTIEKELDIPEDAPLEETRIIH
jgi:hypothetical protein